MSSGPLLVVARLGRPHGLRGELVVELIGDDPARLDPGRELWFEKPGAPGRRLRIASLRGHVKRYLIRFEGIESREQADRLRGGDLSVAFDPADAGEGEFYAHQLQGLAVWTAAGVAVGRVANVAFLPGRAFLEVEREGRGDTLLVPFHADIVKSVDPARGQVVIDPPDGLLDL